MPAGRPPKFNTPEEMQEAIDAFYKESQDNEWPLTISGLALALGMTTESLRRYSEKDGFSATVKTAKAKVEADVERRLLSGGAATGAIFWLKNNANWKDKTEQDHTSSDGSMTPQTVVLKGVPASDA